MSPFTPGCVSCYDSSVLFEAAVEAIVNGDQAGLAKLLHANPELVRERSERAHRSTLLHYVAANGVEDFRQKTPLNIVAITRMLLDAGADVNAESDAYGGQSTALNLAATSVHPHRAGVQTLLLKVLLEGGAEIRRGDIAACLRNGRGEAAKFLAGHGVELDLESAAGVGRLDLVKKHFDREPTDDEKRFAFAWACEFGHNDVVEFLLDHAIRVDAKLPHHGQTGLHWAACGGHVETARLLIARGAPLNAVADRNGGTPLDWAQHAAREGGNTAEVIALLRQASHG